MAKPEKMITSTIRFHEISAVKAGDDKHANVVIRKTAPDPQLENTDMDIKVLKAVLGFDEATKAHFLTLDEAAGLAFVAKTAEEQAADVLKAKKPPMPAEPDADDTKKGIDVETMKSLIADTVKAAQAPLLEQIETMKADRDHQDIVKRAETEFKGYPGGTEAATKILKDISTLPEETRKAVEATMTASVDLAKRLTTETGSRDVAKGSGEEMVVTAAAALVEAAKARGEVLDPIVAKGQILQKDDALLHKGLMEELAGQAPV